MDLSAENPLITAFSIFLVYSILWITVQLLLLEQPDKVDQLQSRMETIDSNIFSLANENVKNRAMKFQKKNFLNLLFLFCFVIG